MLMSCTLWQHVDMLLFHAHNHNTGIVILTYIADLATAICCELHACTTPLLAVGGAHPVADDEQDVSPRVT